MLENLNNKKFGQPDSTVIFNLPYFRRKVNPNGRKTEIILLKPKFIIIPLRISAVFIGAVHPTEGLVSPNLQVSKLILHMVL